MPPRRRSGSRRGALSEEFRSALDAEVRRLEALTEPVNQVVAVGDFYAELDFELEKVAAVRLDAFRKLRREGWTYNRLIEATGLSKTRVSQLANAVRERPQKKRK